MKSKWFGLKVRAVILRKSGKSIRYIEGVLGIPRSTLSGWFRDITLSKEQKKILDKNWKRALISARKKATIWHNEQKEKRLVEAQPQAHTTLRGLSMSSSDILDLALAMLYLGEGFKKSNTTGIGNSDPLILKFFIAVLKKNYALPLEKMKCELHLRADQDPLKMKKYWAKELKIPIKNFTSASIDKRTRGSATYSSYKGVCIVRCGTVSIQRKLLYLSKLFCEGVILQVTGS